MEQNREAGNEGEERGQEAEPAVEEGQDRGREEPSAQRRPAEQESPEALRDDAVSNSLAEFVENEIEIQMQIARLRTTGRHGIAESADYNVRLQTSSRSVRTMLVREVWIPRERVRGRLPRR